MKENKLLLILKYVSKVINRETTAFMPILKLCLLSITTHTTNYY